MIRRTTTAALLAACALAGAGSVALAADDNPSASDRIERSRGGDDNPSASDRVERAPVAGARPSATQARPITRQRAAAIAKARYPRFRVVRITREDDYGSRWEVKMRRGSAELEVYITGRGRIVHVDRERSSGDD
jgi:hypothetical protein